MAPILTEYPQFFTATNLEWKKLLQPDKYKDIVINSMRFLVKDKRTKFFSFVIMENHIHLIWQMLPNNDPEAVQRDFLKYTAQMIKKDLERNHPDILAEYKVNVKDRKYPRLTGRAGVLGKKPFKCRVEKPFCLYAEVGIHTL